MNKIFLWFISISFGDVCVEFENFLAEEGFLVTSQLRNISHQVSLGRSWHKKTDVREKFNYKKLQIMMDAVTLLQLGHFQNHSFLSGKSYYPSHRSGLVGLFSGSVQGPTFLQSPFNFSGDYDKQKNEINGRSWWRKGDFGIWFDGDKNCESDWIIGSISK